MLQALIRSNAGFLLVVASEVFIVFMNVSVKILTEVPLFEVLTYRKSSNLSLTLSDYFAQDGE